MVINYIISGLLITLFFLISVLLLLDFKNEKKENVDIKYMSYLRSDRGKSYIHFIGILTSILFGIFGGIHFCFFK